MRRLPSLAVGLGLFLAAGSTWAMPAVTGESGKGGGDTCASCHGRSSPAPTITTDMPTTLTANTSLDVVMTIAGSLQSTSFDGAFDDDVVVTAGENTTIPFASAPSEVIATQPVVGASGTYKFSIKVPNRNGAMSFYIGAVSSNNDSKSSGERVATTVMSFTITGGPDAGEDTPSGSSSGNSGTSSGGASTAVDAGLQSAAGINYDLDHLPRLPAGESGCQSAPGSAMDAFWISGIAGAIFVLYRARRRRQ